MHQKLKGLTFKQLILLVTVLVLLGITIQTQPATDGGCVTEFIKNWAGNWVNSVHGVTAVLSNGTTVYVGNDASQIDVKGIWQGQTITITWTDGTGHHTETFGPLTPTYTPTQVIVQPQCNDDNTLNCHDATTPIVVLNVINHPTIQPKS